MRRAVWLALALLGSCAPPEPRAVSGASPAAPPEGAVCRVGPDGGPPDPASLADRGIGGTGATPAAVRQADRGIGGTGIVGVVTGFASLCLAGREVALDDAVPVRVDGEPASPAALRVGQLAAVEASGAGSSLRARAVAVRHEAIGPVEGVEAGGVLRVAGQRVALSAQTWMDAPPRRGQWVAVSGLRGPDDTIRATRLDRRAPGTALVRGTLRDEGGTPRIGALEVRPVPGLGALGSRAPAGRGVVASGRYEGGVLRPAALAPDVLAEDPAAYFGRGVAALVLEGYAAGENGRLRLGRGLDVPAAAGIGAFAPRRAVVEFERRPDGSLRATSLRDGGVRAPGEPSPGASGPAPGGPRGAPASGPRPGGGAPPGGRPAGPGEPAPVPSRGFEPAPVPDRGSGVGPDAGPRGDGPGRGAGGAPAGPGPGRLDFGPGAGGGPGAPGGGPGIPGRGGSGGSAPGGGRGR